MSNLLNTQPKKWNLRCTSIKYYSFDLQFTKSIKKYVYLLNCGSLNIPYFLNLKEKIPDSMLLVGGCKQKWWLLIGLGKLGQHVVLLYLFKVRKTLKKSLKEFEKVWAMLRFDWTKSVKLWWLWLDILRCLLSIFLTFMQLQVLLF